MDIVCKNLSFQYNKNTEFAKYALKDASLTIKEGEFFGIIGHTGSGKSTFIQHLNALISVQDGYLTIGDYDLSAVSGGKKKSKRKDKTVKARLKNLRKNVGMVFQYPEYQLFAETVFDDVAFGTKNFFPDAKPDEIAETVNTVLEMVGLDPREVKDKSPFDLSGGQKRRVAIAGVLAAKPEILILDEPCAGLDPAGKTALWALLHKLHGGFVKTIIVVSHDMNDVAHHCTKAAVFDGGTIKKVGTPKELFSDAELIKSCGLEVPVTAYLTDELKKRGIVLDTDYRVEDFAKKLSDYIKADRN